MEYFLKKNTKFNFSLQSSGLSEWVSSQLADVMRNMTTSSAALLLSLMVAAATNVTSNTATATLFLPIVGELVSIKTVVTMP